MCDSSGAESQNGTSRVLKYAICNLKRPRKTYGLQAPESACQLLRFINSAGHLDRFGVRATTSEGAPKHLWIFCPHFPGVPTCFGSGCKFSLALPQHADKTDSVTNQQNSHGNNPAVLNPLDNLYMKVPGYSPGMGFTKYSGHWLQDALPCKNAL